jgi:methyltransferase family protein
VTEHEGMHVLPGSPYQRFLLPLDYMPSRQYAPRWGYSRPTHPGLVAILAKDPDAYRAIVSELRSLKPFLSRINTEFTNERAPEAGWTGGPITALDLALLYYFIFKYKPSTYVEIGSGCTTCMARRAVQDHKLQTRIVSVDPEPRAGIDSICDDVVRDGLETMADLQLFEGLQPGDVVFVDGSHRSFMNSDVTVFMLDVLPKLKPGVLVHFHDVFLPYDYPTMFENWYWNEQYLVASYLLAARERIRILMPSYFMSMTPGLSEALRPPILDLPGHEDDWFFGGSLWFTNVEAATTKREFQVDVDTAQVAPSVGAEQSDELRHPTRRSRYSVITDKPVAYDSPDHVTPWGTSRDNSVSPLFNAKLGRWIPPEEMSVLDLGCAGGGFIKSLHDMGCFGIGIEGSDFSGVPVHRGRDRAV